VISLGILTQNEEKALPMTLAQLLVWPGDYDLIVVDGRSKQWH